MGQTNSRLQQQIAACLPWESAAYPWAAATDADYEHRKLTIYNQYMAYFFDRLRQMFRWKNLPATVSERYLERALLVEGNACFTRWEDGHYYVFVGGLGGTPDCYYRPTIYTIANPVLGSKNLEIGIECIRIRNDSAGIGLTPLNSRYACQLTENDLSIYNAQILTRTQNHITTPDTRTKQAADKYLQSITNGQLTTCAENAFLEGIKIKPSAIGERTITQLIELQQYIKASWWLEVGLQSNYNMKREALNSSESGMNYSSLLPLADDMLHQRKKACCKINALYGLDIDVEFSSAWERTRKEVEIIENSHEGAAETIAESRTGCTDTPAPPPETAEQSETEAQAGGETEMTITGTPEELLQWAKMLMPAQAAEEKQEEIIETAEAVRGEDDGGTADD